MRWHQKMRPVETIVSDAALCHSASLFHDTNSSKRLSCDALERFHTHHNPPRTSTFPGFFEWRTDTVKPDALTKYFDEHEQTAGPHGTDAHRMLLPSAPLPMLQHRHQTRNASPDWRALWQARARTFFPGGWGCGRLSWVATRARSITFTSGKITMRAIRRAKTPAITLSTSFRKRCDRSSLARSPAAACGFLTEDGSTA